MRSSARFPPEVLHVDGGEAALVGDFGLVPENNLVRDFIREFLMWLSHMGY